MPGKNDFVPFGIGTGANVLTPAQYSALGARLAGFSSGILPSINLNTVLRQPSVMAAMIGQFIADASNLNAADDGDIPTLLSNFEAALAVATGVSVPSVQRVHFGQDTGSLNNIVADMSPKISSYEIGAIYNVRVLNANTGPATANLSGLGAKAVVRSNGLPVRAKDYNTTAVLTYDGTNMVLLNIAQEIAPPGTGFGGSQARPGFIPTPGTNYDLTATFTPAYSGVVTCYSRANMSYGTDGASVANQILINNAATGSGDLINGASTSIVVVSTPAGVPFTLTSRVYSTSAFSGRAMSQYLDYSFIPA